MILIVGGACQGKKNYAKEHYGENYTIVDEYHKKVKVALKNGDNPIDMTKKLLEQEENLVIISDELGYGLVPVDKFERDYREANGRVNCYLAERATKVIRVICGIGTQIK